MLQRFILVLAIPSFARPVEPAFQRENGGSWTAYNIGRDYLGSITHIAASRHKWADGGAGLLLRRIIRIFAC